VASTQVKGNQARNRPGSSATNEKDQKNLKRAVFGVSSLLVRFLGFLLRASFGPSQGNTADMETGKRKDEEAEEGGENRPRLGKQRKRYPNRNESNQQTAGIKDDKGNLTGEGRKEGRKERLPNEGDRKKRGEEKEERTHMSEPEGVRELQRGKAHRDAGQSTNKDDNRNKNREIVKKEEERQRPDKR